MLKVLKTGVAAAALAIGLAGGALAQQNEPVGIAELSWDAATALAHVMREIIETRLDTEAEVKKADAAAIMASMDKGEPGGIDIYPELWMPNQKERWVEYIDNRKTVVPGKQPYKGEQALFIPKYVQDEHGVKSIEDLKKPEIAKLFDTDGDGLGEYWPGAPDWNSTNTWLIKFKSYGLDELWEPVAVSDTIFKGQLDSAYTKKEPVLFYYWTPEWIHAAYDLVRIQEPAYTEGCMQVYQPGDREDWLEASNFNCQEPDAEVWNAYSKSLETRNPAVACLVRNMTLTPDLMNEWILKVGRDKVNPEDLAEEWVAENKETIDKWLEGCEA